MNSGGPSGDQERNLATARAALEAFNRGDVEAFLATLDPEVEVWSPPELPNPGTFHGRDGYLRWFSEWMEAWDSFEVEATGLESVGSRHVLISVRQRGRGKGSGVEVEMVATYMAEYRDGLATRFHLYPSHERAREAAEAAELADEEPMPRPVERDAD